MIGSDSIVVMLTLAGLPCLHGYDACMVYWIREAPRRICRQKYGKTSFSPFWFFCLLGILEKGLGVQSFGIFGLGGPGILGYPPSLPSLFGVEFLNVGCWLTHGDLASEVGVDFLAVAEHRLILARVTSECPGSGGKG